AVYFCVRFESTTANVLYTSPWRRMFRKFVESLFVLNASSENFRAASNCLKSSDCMYRAKLLLPSLRFDWAATGDTVTPSKIAMAIRAIRLLLVGRRRFVRRCIVVFTGIFTIFLVFSFFNKLL